MNTHSTLYNVILMQVKDCLKQNEELRGLLDKLRTEQSGIGSANDKLSQRGFFGSNKEGVNGAQASEYSAEIVSLKVRP